MSYLRYGMMTYVRYGIGIVLILAAEFLSHVAHMLIHAGAWLTDQDITNCNVCRGEP